MHIYNVPEPLIILKPSFIIVDCCTKVQTGVRWTVVHSHSHQEWVCKRHFSRVITDYWHSCKQRRLWQSLLGLKLDE